MLLLMCNFEVIIYYDQIKKSGGSNASLQCI
jgi:hypothetical protein